MNVRGDVLVEQGELFSENQEHQKQRPFMSKTKILKRYIPIVLLNLLFIITMIYFISPWSKVDTISIVGNQAVYDQTIIDKSLIKKGDSVIELFQKKEQIEQEVTDGIVQVSNTEIELTSLNDVVIQVEEFDTVAYIAQDGAYLRVLENGKVLDDVFNISLGNQLVLSNFKEGRALDLMIEQLSHLDAPILDLISEIELLEHRSNSLFIQVFMNNGNRVLSSIPTFSEKITYYPQMVTAVSGQKGVFDMEVGVYFVPFKEGQEITSETELDEENRQPVEGFND